MNKGYVKLAAGVWGNEAMEQAARDRLASDLSLDCVEVLEHGGWFMTWNRDLVCVDTANESAVLTPAARKWWAQFQ